MTAAMLEYAIGNTLLAIPLAVIAWAIGRGRRNPSIAHFAWVLVLVRLAMPPVAAVPWLSIDLPGAAVVRAAPATASGATASASRGASDGPPSRAPAPAASDAPAEGSPSAAATDPAVDPWLLLGAAWLTGTVVVILVSAVRIARFARALRRASMPAGPAVVRLAERAAERLGMPLRAEIRVASTGTVPFVWSSLGRTSVVLPATVIGEMSDQEALLVLTHELAHVRRRDHLVRWLDWAVVAWLWWNPLAWIARRGIRASEELACDALVLRTRGAVPRDYGRCLLTVAESISATASRAPAQACTMGDGGSLEERIRLIMSDTLRTKPSATLRTLTVAAAGASMLLGVACGGNAQVTASRQGGTSAPAPSAAPAASPAPAPSPEPASPPAPEPGPAAAASGTVDAEGRTKTMQATVDGASGLDVSSMNGSITVVQDASATSMQVTAVVGGEDWSASESKRKKVLERAKLVAEKDAAGRVSVRVDLADRTNAVFQMNNPPNIDITVRVASLSSVSAETMNGTVSVTGGLGAVSATTMNGTVDISGATGALKARSMNGEVKVALAEGATASVDVECTNGKVSLDLPASWNGTVDASATNGSVSASGITGSSDRSWTGEDFEGTAGTGGSAKAALSVVNGSVKVRRP